jgi:hypothetical protein
MLSIYFIFVIIYISKMTIEIFYLHFYTRSAQDFQTKPIHISLSEVPFFQFEIAHVFARVPTCSK